MEIQTSHLDNHDNGDHTLIEMPSDHRSNVDASRPFRSVKEAVAIFGERFLPGEVYAPKTSSFPEPETPVCFHPENCQETVPSRPINSSISSNGDNPNIAETLKKLEAELEATKLELKKLKDRESETEVALATLNAELHKNMSKLARAEAAAAAKAAMNPTRILSVISDDRNRGSSSSGQNKHQDDGISEEDRRRDVLVNLENSPTLAQIFSGTAADKEGWFEANFEASKERRVKKKTPIVPIVTDLFWKKKGSETSVINPLCAASHQRLN